ncbi:MAG: hypothetical protein RL141_907 [Candidatus Parcubacteria bacterium]
MTSTRLPGKVLMPLAGTPALARMIDRLRHTSFLDGIVIATTTNATDDPIVALAERLGVGVFRGSEEDVLGRVVGAARSAKADIIVELTADCPLMDPRVVDRGITEFFEHPCDVAANVIRRSYADGLDVQVYATSLLASVAEQTQDPLDREHVTRYVYQREGRPYRIHHWGIDGAYAWPELRITLDERDDWRLIDAVFEALLPSNPVFSYEEIVDFLRTRPDLVALNAHVIPKTV